MNSNYPYREQQPAEYNGAYSPYGATPPSPPPPPPPPKKGLDYKVIIPIISIAVVIFVFALLVFTHVICLNHDWKEATCTQPEICKYCDKEQGEAAGHRWKKATCMKPKICSVCDETKGEALDHEAGDWIVSKEATLVSEGTRSRLCEFCDEELDAETIEEKTPGVDGRLFNFKDDEFLKWLEDEIGCTVSYTNQLDDDESATVYEVQFSTFDGYVWLGHEDVDSKDDNICCVGFAALDESATGYGMACVVTNKITERFDSSSASSKLVRDEVYIVDSLVLVRNKLEEGLDWFNLFPLEYYED